MKSVTASERHYRAVVIGGSSGGLTALQPILAALPVEFPLVIIVVQHRRADSSGDFVSLLNACTALPVEEAQDKQSIQAGHVYTAPANYHLLAETTKSLALNIDEPVNYARPSIDVLFESAARVWGDELIGILLSGANADGAEGLSLVKKFGGLTLVQDPASTQASAMPLAAIKRGAAEQVLTPKAIGQRLMQVTALCGIHIK